MTDEPSYGHLQVLIKRPLHTQTQTQTQRMKSLTDRVMTCHSVTTRNKGHRRADFIQFPTMLADVKWGWGEALK
jgi:hypothetical protein